MDIKTKNTYKLYFIENITIVSWLFYILPYILKEKISYKNIKKKIYFIDATTPAILLASFFCWIVRLSLEKIDFRLVDIKDDKGLLLRLRIAYFDLAEVRQDIFSRAGFQFLKKEEALGSKIPIFLARQILSVDLHSNATLWRAMLLIHIAVWKRKKEGLTKLSPCVLFMNKRLWLKEIKRYAAEYAVTVMPVRTWQIRFKNILINICGSKLKILQSLYFYFKREGARSFLRNLLFKGNYQKLPKKVHPDRRNSVFLPPKLALQYCGNFNLDRPELNSDLFFWQQSDFPAESILVMFDNAIDPLDKTKWDQIRKHKMSAIATSLKAVACDEAPIFYHWLGRYNRYRHLVSLRRTVPASEKRWIEQQLRYYSAHFNYWLDLFNSHNIKVYLSWYKYDAYHCLISDAIKNTGGVNVIYQRAYEELPSARTTIDCDIVFGFSPLNAEFEFQSGSKIPYYVAVGYPGGHRFSLLRNHAQAVRNKLRANGAQRILALFDENSADDSRWHTGHELQRDNYEFLLHKVIEESWLGLVIKPKVPSTLRKRLGPLAALLKEAEATGRCFVFEAGVVQGAYPPSVAALASDIAVHGHLCAATAGVESALAGVPTLLIDREGWNLSPLYRLGKGKVIFTNWQDLWKSCQDYWQRPKGITGFGDWSGILDEIDPFRDGRAAERTGTYLKWLIEGFKAKLPRKTVLADAAQRYSKIWGKDKISQSKGQLFSGQSSFLNSPTESASGRLKVNIS